MQFEGLIECDSTDISSDVINSSLSFTHCIGNTSKIEKATLLSAKEIKSKKRSALINSVSILVLLVSITAFNFFNLFGSAKEPVFFKRVGDKSGEFYFANHKDNIVTLDSQKREP